MAGCYVPSDPYCVPRNRIASKFASSVEPPLPTCGTRRRGPIYKLIVQFPKYGYAPVLRKNSVQGYAATFSSQIHDEDHPERPLIGSGNLPAADVCGP